jgi:plastocyanin
MTIRRLLTATALAAVLVACSDSGGPGTQSDIEVRDNAFSPSALTADAGTTLTWEWTGGSPHNVTWVGPGAPAASATQTAGTYQRTFDAAGVYDYYCTIHGTPTSGMRGSVTVP